MQKVMRTQELAINWLVGVGILGILFHILVDVFARNVLNTTIHGTIDYVSYWWMPAIVLLALTSAVYSDEHIRVSGITVWMSPRMRFWLSAGAFMVTVVFAGVIGWFGLIEALEQVSIGEYSGASGVWIWPGRLVLPIAAASFVLASILTWISAMKQGRSAGDADSTGETSS